MMPMENYVSLIGSDCSGRERGTMRNIPASITDCSRHSAEWMLSRFDIPLINGMINRQSNEGITVYTAVSLKFICDILKNFAIEN